VADSDRGSRFSSTALTRAQSRWLPSLLSCARPQFGWAIAAPILAGALLVAQVWLLARMLGGAIVSAMPVADAAPYIAGVVGLILARAALAWSGERAASRGGETIKLRLRQALFERLLDQGPSWTRTRVSGELAGSIVDQVELVDGFFTRYVPSAIAAAFLPLAFGAVLLPLDWVAALILLLSAPLIPVFMALVGWGAEAASRRHQRELTRLSGFFADRLRGAFTLKLFGREKSEVDAVRAASDDLSRRNMAVLRIAFLSSAVLEFFAALGVAAVALYVGLSYLGYLHLRASALTLPLGLFALFMAPEVYNPLRQFAANYHDRAAARAAVEQIAALFDGLPRRDPAAGRGTALCFPDSAAGTSRAPAPQGDGPDAGGAVALRGLTIRAADRGRILVRDVSLDIGRHEHVAVMGASGAGKTTLLEAVAGLRPLASGRIQVLGKAVFPGAPPDLGGDVAMIGQRPFFLSGSIAENLRIADPDACDHDLRRALQQACADDFVAASPEGMATRLGMGGYGLSGGQLHRLALARLFLLDPRLVLLDEPTEHLDAATRDRVVQSLLRFSAGRALVVVTHDAGVAARMDRTLVIDGQGGIVERA